MLKIFKIWRQTQIKDTTGWFTFPKYFYNVDAHLYRVCKHYVYFQGSVLRRLWVFNTTLGPLCQSGCGYLTSDNNVNTTDGSARSYKNGSQGDS